MPFLTFEKYILTVYYIMKRAEKQDFSPAGRFSTKAAARFLQWSLQILKIFL